MVCLLFFRVTPADRTSLFKPFLTLPARYDNHKLNFNNLSDLASKKRTPILSSPLKCLRCLVTEAFF